MAISDQDWKAEQTRVTDVTAKISSKITQLEADVGLVRGDVINMRKEFWDEVTVNFSNPDDLGETSTNLRQQAQVLSERERSHLQSSKALKKYKKLVYSPYFGRIDFREEDMNQEEPIYLGIGSFMDDDSETFLVYDWRAPISSLYYDGAPGITRYETPSGTVTGEMSLKRQFVIHDGVIEVLFDTGVTIGDELLQQVLSHSADDRMKSIVATIQREQNAVIRNDKTRMLIVQGAAGSGKTSAALQRVAYLLYKYREVLQADQMILFSPNPLFNSYVSTVLPELGEENMQQTTFQSYLEHRLGREFELEDVFTQTEILLNAPDTPAHRARLEGIAYKSSVPYLDVIRSYKDLLEREGMMFRPVVFQGRVIISGDEMTAQFYGYDSAVKLAGRLDLMREWMLKRLSDFSNEERKASWVEDHIELMDPDDYHRAYQTMRRKQSKKEVSFNDFDQERELLGRMVVSDRLKPLRRWIKRFRFVDVKGLYRKLFADERLFRRLAGNEAALPGSWTEVCSQTMQKIEHKELFYEDATPFLYLKELLQGFRTNTSIRHVIVDEVQDYSAFQLEFLKRLFPRAKMTVLGDLNQAIYAHGEALGSLENLVSLYGKEETEVINLTRSYRSTYEIVEFTRKMIPGGEVIVPFNRPGEEPCVIPVKTEAELTKSVISDIRSLHDKGYHYVAVICKTEEESRRVQKQLSAEIPVRLITKNTPAFEKGTLVVPAYLAKGVEFDAVIIYNGSNEVYSKESERKLFYTACTRAMHELHIYHVGEKSTFLPQN
ncbi:DNA helicase-2 / ATP-dependent DNA helicase PcrA [Paenibacillus uliginis N3/975]|uniref:DNA helicase-2 / ATP-dependent DNA helicase PcrA n=1 Tax=Paenibacillus uliginis N3/975 TaxID=1313296 RepID=A0A1X7H7L9_9BACL|nr:RNA polymerase recycling motor HelD [Paenibacillus uliginis]SMF81085.1 DNA helicase-2 / ATP-dependent DNA helicase PcrA [Paenibacillus uliginis N3/975]